MGWTSLARGEGRGRVGFEFPVSRSGRDRREAWPATAADFGVCQSCLMARSRSPARSPAARSRARSKLSGEARESAWLSEPSPPDDHGRSSVAIVILFANLLNEVPAL